MLKCEIYQRVRLATKLLRKAGQHRKSWVVAGGVGTVPADKHARVFIVGTLEVPPLVVWQAIVTKDRSALRHVVLLVALVSRIVQMELRRRQSLWLITLCL